MKTTSEYVTDIHLDLDEAIDIAQHKSSFLSAAFEVRFHFIEGWWYVVRVIKSD